MQTRKTGIKPIRVICVTGGKGGVGKTVFSINLSLALCQQRHRVLLFDADLGLANVDVALGLQINRNLAHVLAGDCDISDIIVTGPLGLAILPASSGKRELTRLTPVENAGIIRAFSELSGHYDVLTIDTAAGISDSVIDFVRASQEIILVVTNEPTSITDAYALIKSMASEKQENRYHVVANMVEDAQEGKALFTKLTKVTQKFLDAQLNYIGHVTNDEYVKKAVRKRQALLELYPSCLAAKNIQEIAKRVEKLPMPAGASGHIEFFVEQLVNASYAQPGTSS